jgi:phosphate transport system protein
MAVDHIIAELERLGDIAVNIAEEVLELLRLPDQDLHPFLTQMAFMAQTMVQRSLSAFVERNPRLAREVCQADREVDDLDRLIIQELLAAMEGHKDAIAFDHAQVNIVRNLERAADHATNIAEQVVFMVEGESVRHRCQG